MRKLAGGWKGCRNGTDDWQMLEAIRGLGLVAEALLAENRSAAWAFIRSSLSSGRAVVICIDNYQHWVAAIGVCGEQVIVADPSGSQRNMHENGVHSLGRVELLRRWQHRNRGEHYGIALGRKR